MGEVDRHDAFPPRAKLILKSNVRCCGIGAKNRQLGRNGSSGYAAHYVDTELHPKRVHLIGDWLEPDAILC